AFCVGDLIQSLELQCACYIRRTATEFELSVAVGRCDMRLSFSSQI
ncbi:unnamed protein product, partial [Musa hybrid cultivar]